MKASEFTTLWLKAPDLPESGAQATIETVEARLLHPRPGQEKRSLVIGFKNKVKKLILNDGNINRLVRIAGTEDVDAWIGLVVRLVPATYGGKGTIIIEQASGGTNGH